MKLKFLIILICIYSSLFSQNTNCIPQVEPMPSPALLIPRLIWYNQTATTLNVQKVQNNINDWTAGGMVNRPIADGESITFRSNSGIKAVGLALKKTEANMLWRQPHSVLYGFYINRWSGTAYPMESQGSADTRIDYENEGRPWNDNSVFKIKRVCNKVYYYMDDIQFPHVSTISNTDDLYFDMNFRDVLGWVYDVTIYGACGIQDCTNGSITPTFTQIDPICAGGTFTLPTTSSNTVPVTGTWSPAINNQGTTTYAFTPNAGQSASTATMTVTVNNPTAPTFTQISPICRGGTFTLPTTSNNGIIGSWSPAINNQATTEYTFTPTSGQCASNTTMTVIVNNATVPTFTQVSPICAGGSFSLPTTSDNGITGTWSPAVNNQATTEYTFTPNPGQCANTTTMTVTVNPSASLVLSSGSNNQTVDANTPISSIVYTFGGTTGGTVSGFPTGVTHTISNNTVTISGSPSATGTFLYTITTTGSCGTVNLQGTIIVSPVADWKLAPNSYIFTGKDKNGSNVDGLYIPVKKAYEMWRNGNYIKGTNVPTGTITADVLWEDNMGLIKSKENYTLDIIGTGESAEIKVPVNKVKKGNAIVAYKVNGVIFWSWHVWVTDDPTNGSTYKSYDDVKRELSNGTVETIPNSEWGWMDRNLGAMGSSLNGNGWNRNGGLLYQWGRKDPFPPLTNRDASFYQITGSMGKIVYDDAYGRLNFPTSPFNDYKKFNDLRVFVDKSAANITDNIRTSVKNPLSLIYVNDDRTTTPSTYATIDNVPYYYNWFGQVPGLQTNELSKVNLWSDNSLGIPTQTSDIGIPKPYRNKSSYDPCPNGWRLPSVLVATSTKNLRMDFTPFGPKVSSPLSALNVNLAITRSNIQPGLSNLKPYLGGIKVYPQYGFDMTNVAGNNMGTFPGTGWIGRGITGDDRYHTKPTYTDQLETYLWTATMTSFGDISSIASGLRLIPSADQIANNYKPDTANYPNVYGFYSYKPADDYSTNDAHACRCIKDPLFVKNTYDFETKYFSETETYKMGLDNPNSYMITKSTTDQIISIPVSKAFSVQSNYLGNTQILNSANFNALKANVLWTDTPGLITQLTIDNPSSKDGNINVKVNANQSGNAVVTLHNGSISNPIYWSWHIWVSNTPVNSVTYINDNPITTDNYLNYTQYGTIMKTIIMDRNLGAVDVTPASYNPSTPTDVIQLNNSQGLHYQWGRKDALPTFNKITPSLTKFNVFLGTTNNGIVTYPTILTEANYTSSNIVNYNTYKSNITTTDKIDVRIEKILGYSVANPLKFMMPNVVYPTPSEDINYILGSDWLFDTNYHALYAERWGLGDKKSVFDPCPNGWRIPETGTSPTKSSPWSFKNYSESTLQTVSSTEVGYYGSAIYSVLASPYGNTVGFVFNNSLYNTGNYPKGYIRGKRSVVGVNPLDSTVNNPVVSGLPSGIWYANLQQNMTGRGTYMNFDKFARILVKSTDIDPYAAMSCRCVKQEDNGVPRGPLPGLPVTTNTTGPAPLILSTQEIDNMAKNKLIVFPNPVKDLLNLYAKDDKDYYYQIYNMAGQLVKKGKFNNKQTDISDLSTGNYLVRINNSESIVKIIKQ